MLAVCITIAITDPFLSHGRYPECDKAGLLMSRRCGKSRGVNPKAFFPEPRRRNLYKVAVAYAVALGLFLQTD